MNRQAQTGSRRIGLFDSGVGGLSVLKALQESALIDGLDLRFIYLADTGRCPYGNRSRAEISRYVEEIVSFFNAAGVDQIVMACNTSAAVAEGLARKLAKMPVQDLISTASRHVSQKYSRTAVLATSTTCKSQAFTKSIKTLNPDHAVVEIPCVDLVPLVESGLFSGSQIDQTINKYVKEIISFQADSVIFGCTHFPFLKDAFRSQLQHEISFIDPANYLKLDFSASHRSSSRVLLPATDTETACRIDAFKKTTYFCTGCPESFAKTAELCLNIAEGSLKNSVVFLSEAELQTEFKPSGSQKHTRILVRPLLAPGLEQINPL